MLLALDSDLEANAIGFSEPSLNWCDNTAPTPYMEASHAKVQSTFVLQ